MAALALPTNPQKVGFRGGKAKEPQKGKKLSLKPVNVKTLGCCFGADMYLHNPCCSFRHGLRLQPSKTNGQTKRKKNRKQHEKDVQPAADGMLPGLPRAKTKMLFFVCERDGFVVVVLIISCVKGLWPVVFQHGLGLSLNRMGDPQHGFGFPLVPF